MNTKWVLFFALSFPATLFAADDYNKVLAHDGWAIKDGKVIVLNDQSQYDRDTKGNQTWLQTADGKDGDEALELTTDSNGKIKRISEYKLQGREQGIRKYEGRTSTFEGGKLVTNTVCIGKVNAEIPCVVASKKSCEVSRILVETMFPNKKMSAEKVKDCAPYIKMFQSMTRPDIGDLTKTESQELKAMTARHPARVEKGADPSQQVQFRPIANEDIQDINLDQLEYGHSYLNACAALGVSLVDEDYAAGVFIHRAKRTQK